MNYRVIANQIVFGSNPVTFTLDVEDRNPKWAMNASVVEIEFRWLRSVLPKLQKDWTEDDVALLKRHPLVSWEWRFDLDGLSAAEARDLTGYVYSDTSAEFLNRRLSRRETSVKIVSATA